MIREQQIRQNWFRTLVLSFTGCNFEQFTNFLLVIWTDNSFITRLLRWLNESVYLSHSEWSVDSNIWYYCYFHVNWLARFYFFFLLLTYTIIKYWWVNFLVCLLLLSQNSIFSVIKEISTDVFYWRWYEWKWKILRYLKMSFIFLFRELISEIWVIIRGNDQYNLWPTNYLPYSCVSLC